MAHRFCDLVVILMADLKHSSTDSHAPAASALCEGKVSQHDLNGRFLRLEKAGIPTEGMETFCLPYLKRLIFGNRPNSGEGMQGFTTLHARPRRIVDKFVVAVHSSERSLFAVVQLTKTTAHCGVDMLPAGHSYPYPDHQFTREGRRA